MPERAPAVPQDPRPRPSQLGDEASTLTGFLRWQRETLAWKCAGLADSELARRAVAPSPLSLLGLVRHLAEAERHWFRRVLAGDDVPGVFGEDSWHGARADASAVADAWEAWRAEVDAADRFVAGAESLDVRGHDEVYGAVSLRWVLVHMVEEYARHNGHADLLRERIDGAVGE